MKEGTKMGGRKAHYKQPKVRSSVRALVIASDRRRGSRSVRTSPGRLADSPYRVPARGLRPTPRGRAGSWALRRMFLTLENAPSMGERIGRQEQNAGSGLLDEFSYY
jgi:hypothetical protein